MSSLMHAKQSGLLLNCDLGESFGPWKMGNDAEIMPLIDCANIACGFHAGDPLIMSDTVALAVANQEIIGAHPGYPDKEGFGRRSMAYQRTALIAMLQYQVGALQAICQSHQTKVEYIKPHGALYNDMMVNMDIFESVVLSAQSLSLPLMIQALPKQALTPFIAISESKDVPLLFEGFADRQYQRNGKLVPRSQPNAVLHDSEQVVQQCQNILKRGVISAEDNVDLTLKVDSLCVHGDTPDALHMLKRLREFLNQTAC